MTDDSESSAEDGVPAVGPVGDGDARDAAVVSPDEHVHDVVIAGGGPTGLMLAAELRISGVDVVVVERRADQHVDGSRAGGLHSRTIEVLDQRGVADRFLAAGQTYPFLGYGQIMLDISDFPTRHNYVLGLWQREIELILAGWVEDLGVPIRRSREVSGFTQDLDGVDVHVSDGTTIRTQYLVGCDGGRSLVRREAGIEFAGLDASTSWLIAEVEMDGEPELGYRRDADGTHAMGRRTPADPVRVVITEPTLEHGEPDLNDLRSALHRVYGTDFGLRSVSWISRFTDVSRQAVAYRRGRVLLAGDAAHVHPPQGGQGLNTGVQDAVNLGWKLALVVRGVAPESLLDSYHDERHPVGARVLRNTMAQVALAGADERHQALRDAVTEWLSMDGPRREVVGMISGLDIRYDIHDEVHGEGGGEHPLVGRRMPDVGLETIVGPLRASALLRRAHPVAIDLGGGLDLGPWADRVDLVEATYDGPWELPVVGEVPAPAAVLVRPDGYVAWVGQTAGDDPAPALARWFGPPAAVEDGAVDVAESDPAEPS